MIKHKKNRLGMTLLLAAASTGCAGWPGQTASTDDSFDSTEQRLVEAQKQIDAYKEKQQSASYGPGYANKSEPSFMGSIQEAFTPEPTVNKPADPVALANKPNQIGADVFLTAGAFFDSQGQLDRAKGQYERALTAEPNNLLALVSLARLADKRGNAVEAETIYNRAIAAHPTSALAYNDLGLFHARKGQTEKAVAALGSAASLEPENVRYNNNFATLLVEAGQYDKALAQLSKTSGPAEAHYNLGFLLHRNQQDQLAVHHLNEALRLNPRLQQAHVMLAKLQSTSQAQAQAAPAQYQPQALVTPSQEYVPYGGSREASVYTANQPSVRQLPPVQ